MKTLKTLITIFLASSLLFSYGQTRKDSLYVFVGEKINTKGFRYLEDTTQIPFDYAIKAKYRVIKNVYGNYNKDTIEFESYDHFGRFPFLDYKYVLLFVSNYNGRFIHEKYQFFDVYKTTNGRWASSYKIADYNHPYNKNTIIKPELIEFDEEVMYKPWNKRDIEDNYPSPYYKVVEDKVVAVWGNYIEELFELKKNSILKARGIFN